MSDEFIRVRDALCERQFHWGKVGWIELQIHRVKGGSIEGIMM